MIRKVLWRGLKKSVLMMYIKIIQDMYENGKISVKNVCRETEDFTANVCVH